MDQQVTLYWLRAAKDYLEAEQHRKMYALVCAYDLGLQQMINAIDSAIDYFDSEIQSYRNYQAFEKEEFPW